MAGEWQNRRPPWSKALSVLTEDKAKGVFVYSLICHAAECDECGWRSPLVQTLREADHARARHLDAGCPMANIRRPA